MSPSSFAAFRTVGPSSSTAARSWHPVSSERVRSDAHNLPFSPLSHFNDRLSASMSWQSLGAPGLTIDGGGGDGAGAAGRFGGGDRAGGGGDLNIWDSPTSTRSRCDASAIGGKSSACRGARGDGVRRGWVAKLGEPHASTAAEALNDAVGRRRALAGVASSRRSSGRGGGAEREPRTTPNLAAGRPGPPRQPRPLDPQSTAPTRRTSKGRAGSTGTPMTVPDAGDT